MPISWNEIKDRAVKSVDAAYGKRKFSGDRDRVTFLFELYQQLVSPLSAKKNLRRKPSG
jgi:hypothetical protein